VRIVILGIDLGKNICSLVGVDEDGGVVLRRRMRRQTVHTFAAKLPACIVAMEACCGAHYLGRLLAAQGHTVKLMSPEYVRPYVKAQKNDDRDAEGIAEAASRPTMRFVELKSQEQLDLQALHRVRSRLVGARRTLLNQLRAILLERGHIFPQGRRKLEAAVDALVSDPASEISRRVRQLVTDIRLEWQALDSRIEALNAEFIAIARHDDAARRLVTIPGVGVLNATALVAAVGDGAAFRRGRDLGAWLGLVPKQHTTGGRPKLLGISKRATNTCGCCSSMAPERPCHRWRKASRRLGHGCAGFSPGAIAISLLWRWPTSWRASPGQPCGGRPASICTTSP
jgi:transposase